MFALWPQKCVDESIQNTFLLLQSNFSISFLKKSFLNSKLLNSQADGPGEHDQITWNWLIKILWYHTPPVLLRCSWRRTLRCMCWCGFADFNNSCNHFVFITHCSFNLHISGINPSRRNVWWLVFALQQNLKMQLKCVKVINRNNNEVQKS